MTEHEKRIRALLDYHANSECALVAADKADLRALLADLDAMRGALERISCAAKATVSNPEWIAAHADAALSAAKDGGWLPIETAPKDGTVVILGRAGDDEDIASVVTTGHWQEAEEDGVDYMGADAGFVDEHYQEFNPGRSFGTPSYRYAPTQPTHWQPLPNPPKGEV